MNNHYNSLVESSRIGSGGRTRVGKIYKQFYRKAWEEIPEFKEWLTSIPGERSKAYCKICERSLHAHRLSLTKHTVSLKHMRLAQRKAQMTLNLECYDEPCPEALDGLSEVEENVDATSSTSYTVMPEEHVKNVDDEEEEENEEMVIAAATGDDNRTKIIYTTEDGDNIIYEAAVSTTSSAASQQAGSSQGSSIQPQEEQLSLVKIVQQKNKLQDKVGGRVTTHVIDISKGMPVAGLSVSLYQLQDGRWMLLSEGTTNGDGRWGEGGSVGLKPGRYKLHYDTERYFLLRHQPTFYPFVEVVFDMCSLTDKYHLPLILGPHGFTTYKGC